MRDKTVLEVLVQRYQAKPGPRLFDKILAEMEPAINKIVSTLHCDREQRAECYQLVSVEIYKALSLYKQVRGTWWTYIHSRLLGWQRHYYRTLRDTDTVDTKEWEMAEDFTDIGTDSLLVRIMIEEAIQNLPQIDQELFQDHLDGWSCREIAKKFCTSPMRVSRLVNEIKSKIQCEVLEDDTLA